MMKIIRLFSNKLRQIVFSFLLMMVSFAMVAQSSMYGDVNGDNNINITDVNYVINVILTGRNTPNADVNGDGQINITDINVIINMILNPTQIPEDVHVFGDGISSEGTVNQVTENYVIVTCQPGMEPKVGEIIVCGITDNSPVGFLRRVESVQSLGGQCIMTTTNASLEEVLPDGDYHIAIPMVITSQDSTVDGPSQAPSRAKFSTDFKGTVKIGWNGNLPDVKVDVWPFMTPEQEAQKENEILDGNSNAEYPLQVIAKMTPEIELVFDCSVKWGRIQRLELGAGAGINAELLLKATLEKEFKYTGANGLHLFNVPISPVTIPIGGIPIVFTPRLDIYLGMDYKGEMYMQWKLMSASASCSLSYVYTKDPDPITGSKSNFYTESEAKTLGDGDMEKRFQKWTCPKVGLKGSAKFSLDPIINVSVFDANDIFNIGVPISPWVKTEGNLAITLDTSTPELDYEDQVTIDAGLDVGVAAHFKLLGREENWQKDVTLFETELFEPIALTPKFDDVRVSPSDDTIPATTPAVEFGTYMVKPNIQLFHDRDYGFAYGLKDEKNREEKWTFISLKEQYDEGFENDLYKRQYIQAAIDPSSLKSGMIYRVSPFLNLFGAIIYKKGEDFTLGGSVTIPIVEIDFGDVLIGSNQTQIIDIINDSQLPREVNIEVTQPFSLVMGGSCASSQTIEVPANSSSSVTVMFSALKVGDFLGTLTFTSDAIDGGKSVIPLHAHVLSGDHPQSGSFTVNGVSFTMVEVEGGTFIMGATQEQADFANDDEYPSHQVTLSSFAIGETEVTQELWQAVMGCNPSNFNNNLHCPVENVSWNDCQTFISKLNEITGMTFRLPTEAEWEFAARGGNNTHGYIYSGSNDIKAVAWFEENAYDVSNQGTRTVASLSPNELGLYDMSGNVNEWCADWYGRYSSGAQSNPCGPASGSSRIIRGGSWYDSDWFCRVSLRLRYAPTVSDSDLGFRLAL